MLIGLVAKAGELRDARELFDEKPLKDLISWKTILDGYARCIDMTQACLIKTLYLGVMGYSEAGDMEIAGYS